MSCSVSLIVRHLDSANKQTLRAKNTNVMRHGRIRRVARILFCSANWQWHQSRTKTYDTGACKAVLVEQLDCQNVRILVDVLAK